MYSQFLGLVDRFAQLEEYHEMIGDGLWESVFRSMNALIAECVNMNANSVKLELLEENMELDEISSIPNGFKKCSGCGRILEENGENFRRDKNRKSGFRARCKRCLSTKNNVGSKRDEREEEEEAMLVMMNNSEQQGGEKKKRRRSSSAGNSTTTTNSSKTAAAAAAAATAAAAAAIKEEGLIMEMEPDEQVVLAALEELKEDTACELCNGVRPEEYVLLCDVKHCKVPFHPSCAAYPRPPRVGAKFDVFCPPCLALAGLKPEDVLWQEEEDNFLKQWHDFGVDAGGHGSVLHLVWRWLQLNGDVLERSGLASVDALGAALSTAALGMCLEEEKAPEYAHIWQSIQKDPEEAMKRYWNHAALDYFWIALTTRVLPGVAVDIWHVSPQERRPLVFQRYPGAGGGGGGEKEALLSVMRRNVKIAPHYDLLTLKKK